MPMPAEYHNSAYHEFDYSAHDFNGVTDDYYDSRAYNVNGVANQFDHSSDFFNHRADNAYPNYCIAYS